MGGTIVDEKRYKMETVISTFLCQRVLTLSSRT